MFRAFARCVRGLFVQAVIGTLVLVGPAPADETILTPSQAKKKVGEKSVVEMTVSYVAIAPVGPPFHLVSEKDKEFTIMILAATAEKMKENGIQDIPKFYEGALIRVTGKVTREKIPNVVTGKDYERVGILINDPGQIRVVKPRDRSRETPTVGDPAARMDSPRKLKNIVFAFHTYHDVNGSLPAHAIYSKDDKPLLSWRVALLRFMDEKTGALYKEFKLDEPWDSPHNKKLLERMPAIYAPVGDKTKVPYSTHYQVFTGDETAFPGRKATDFSKDFRDGTSRTFLVVEADEPVPWTKPADLEIDPKKPLPKLGGLLKNGFYVATADAEVHFVRRTVKEDTIRAYITPAGGERPAVLDR